MIEQGARKLIESRPSRTRGLKLKNLVQTVFRGCRVPRGRVD